MSSTLTPGDRQMIYTLISSLLIEKPFNLLRPHSFLFQIVKEFIDIFVKFTNSRSRGGAFDSLFCPKGGLLYTTIVLREGFAPSSRLLGVCPGEDGFRRNWYCITVFSQFQNK